MKPILYEVCTQRQKWKFKINKKWYFSVTSVVLNTVFYITGEILISSLAELYVQTLKIIVIT